MISKFTIRTARLDEADLLTELALRSKAYWGYDAAFMDMCRKLGLLCVTPAMIAAESAYVAEVDRQVAGLYTLIDGVDKTAELDMLFVDAPFMGKGVGRALFNHARTVAQSRGARLLMVESDPNAQAFYAAMGMQKYDERASIVQAGRMLPLMKITLD